MPKSKKKYYAVARGRRAGIYKSWPECEAQVKGYRDARFKGFVTEGEALRFMQENTTARRPTRAPTTERKASASIAKRQQTVPKVRTDTTGEKLLSITIHFDGGSRGNPGLGGAGAEVVAEGEFAKEGRQQHTTRTTTHIRKYLGTHVTNNVAEYHGLLCGLNHVQSIVQQLTNKDTHQHPRTINLLVKGDSDLIIKQLNGMYKCKHKNLSPLYDQVKSVVSEIQRAANVETSFEHVYREDNKIADGLANEAMDSRQSWTTTVEDSREEVSVAATKEV